MSTQLTVGLLVAAIGASSTFGADVLVSLKHDAGAQVALGSTTTWTLSVSFDGFAQGAAVSGTNMRIIATQSTFGHSSAFSYTTTNGGNTGGASDSLGGITSVNITNSLFIEAFNAGDPTKAADLSNPFVVGTFELTAAEASSTTFEIYLGDGAGELVSVDESAFSTRDIDRTQVTFDIDTLTVPAPGAMLPLLAGAMALRRRR